ncbi:MAG: PVC-type heme-binding CxxCH protein [Planctomycetota bacterium]|nr:PVC-type heme-binding CxxCH protein [Planctomycetota bacterium]
MYTDQQKHKYVVVAKHPEGGWPGRWVFCWLAVGGLLAVMSLPPGLSAQQFIPKNTQPAGDAPLAPDEAEKRLRVPAGFQITLAAAEPAVQQPIAIAFDDRGRLWVAESYSYDGSTFTDQRHDRILVFEDTTGDGVLDQRHVFCDDLTHLTGLQIGFGGVWVTAPPHLLFVPDRNRDDTPDGEAIVHLDGWSLKAEHNSVNGLTWGPDGWLYGRHGIKQPSLVGRPGTPAEKRVALSCSIWRYHPVRHLFEVVADGTINPWGLDFDEHGQGFLTTNVVDHLWHLVPGAHYRRWQDREVHPDPHVYETMSATSDHVHWSTGLEDSGTPQGGAAQAFGGGHAHCDAMIYLGGHWPDEYRGSLFTSNIHGRRINRDRLVREAGAYRGVHAVDFLVADDPWFRAVSMEYGPDGDVYLTDWADQGECHDRDGVHRTSGRIYKISWGAPRRVAVDLFSASTAQLVKLQTHCNEWYVRHARRLLQERAAAGEDLSLAHAELRRMFQGSAEVTGKLRALWALHSSGGLDRHWLIQQVGHPDEHIRSWAVRLLVDDRPPDAATQTVFAELAGGDPSWLVRMTLVGALRRVPTGSRWTIAVRLGEAIRGRRDANLERMLWYAMEPEVVGQPGRALQTVALQTPRIRNWIARRLTAASGAAATGLVGKLATESDVGVLVDLLEGFNAGLPSADVAGLPPTTAGMLQPLLTHRQRRVRVAAVMALATVGGDGSLQRIRELLLDSDVDRETRRAALEGLVLRRPSTLGADLQKLIRQEVMILPALRAGKVVADVGLVKLVLARYPVFTRPQRVAAVDLLASRQFSARALLDAVERDRVPVADVSAQQARQIAALGDAGLAERLAGIWGNVRPSPADRLRQISHWRRQLDPSRSTLPDLQRGRAVFRQTCANCHKLFGEGRSVGPELTGANRRNLGYLLSNVIDPSAAVAADFQLAVVVTRDGRVVSGAISRRSALGVTIETATETVRIAAGNIDEIKISEKSMMPDGLLEKLSDRQVRDLFGWMMSDGPGDDGPGDDGPGK